MSKHLFRTKNNTITIGRNKKINIGELNNKLNCSYIKKSKGLQLQILQNKSIP